MVKIRISSDNPREVEDAVNLFESLLPDMRFTATRIGGNPKYVDDPKHFSYGEPRVRNKKPIPINFKLIKKKLLSKPASTTNPKKQDAEKRKTKAQIPDWKHTLGLENVEKLTWSKCRLRFRELASEEISQAAKNKYVEAMEAAAKYFKISL